MPYSCDSAKHPCSRERRGNELFADFNVLATLIAAIEILKEVDGYGLTFSETHKLYC
jgi:hypothetical protein